MQKQEHYFVMSCFVIVIGLLIFYRWKNNCRESIQLIFLDVADSVVENFEPPKFKSTSHYSNIVVSDDQGNLSTTSSLDNGLKIKDWSISQTDKKLCFSRNGVAKKICLNADVQSDQTNSVNNGSGISFGDQEINEIKWKKIDPLKRFAGYGLDINGSTFLIFEGNYTIINDGINDTWDAVYVNKGWEIQLWQHAAGSGTGSSTTCKNTTDDLPKQCKLGNLVNQVSHVKATWVGY